MAGSPAVRRVLLAGGGTAGHTSPLLATADALRRRDPSIEVVALGTPSVALTYTSRCSRCCMKASFSRGVPLRSSHFMPRP